MKPQQAASLFWLAFSILVIWGASGLGLGSLPAPGMGFMSFGAASLMPLVLAFIMGPLLEQNLRQSLIMSGGKFSIFVSRPISAVTLALAFLLLLSNIVPFMKRRRKEYEEFKEE